jgi:hypothetical protein
LTSRSVNSTSNGTAAFKATSSFWVFSGWSSIGGAFQRSRTHQYRMRKSRHINRAERAGSLALSARQSRGWTRWLEAWPIAPFPIPRSSNQACGFPASGFPTGFTARHTTVIQRQNAERPVNRLVGESPRSAIGNLMPPMQAAHNRPTLAWSPAARQDRSCCHQLC